MAAWSSAVLMAISKYMDAISLKYTGKPRSRRHDTPSSLLNIHSPTDVATPLRIAGAWQTEGLVFNVEVNLCCGTVLGYLLAVQFHF